MADIFLDFALVFDFARAEECRDALITSTYSSNATYHSDWRLAVHVTEKSYDELKKEGGADVDIFGVSAGGTYGEYHKKALELQNRRKESLTVDQATNIFQRGLQAEAAGAYQACLQAEVFSAQGLKTAVRQATDDQIEITVKWDVPGNPGPITVVWTPSSIGGQDLPTNIPSGISTIIIPRPTKDTLLVANYGGWATQAMRLTPLPKPAREIIEPVAPCIELDDASHKCTACEQAIAEDFQAGGDIRFACGNMAPGRYAASLSGTARVTNVIGGAGSWIAMTVSFEDVPGSEGAQRDYNGGDAAQFALSNNAAQSLFDKGGKIRVRSSVRNCQSGGDNNRLCHVDGKWTIEQVP